MEHGLSIGQNALWLIHRMAPDTAAYNVAWPMRVRGPLDVPALVRAIELTAQRHELLRSVFTEVDGEPRRIVQDELVKLEIRDEPGAGSDRFVELVQAEIARPFRLDVTGPARFVLIRVAPEESALVFVVHHIATDFASLAIVMRDLLDAYAVLKSGGEPEWAPLTHSYQDFVDSERRLIDSPRAQEMSDYWRGRLQGAPTTLELPLDRPRPAQPRYTGSVHNFLLPQDLVDGVFKASRKSRVTPVRFMVGVFQALLYRISSQQDFLLGCEASSSLALSHRGVAGYFSNKLVLRAHCTSTSTFADLIGGVNEQLAGGLANVDFPYAMLSRELGLPSRSGMASLVQVGVSMITVDARDPLVALANQPPGTEAEFEDLHLSAMDLPQQAGQSDLFLEVIRSRTSVRCALKYDTDIFTEASAKRMASHYERLLRAAAADTSQRVAGVSLVDENERARLLAFATGRRP